MSSVVPTMPFIPRPKNLSNTSSAVTCWTPRYGGREAGQKESRAESSIPTVEVAPFLPSEAIFSDQSSSSSDQLSLIVYRLAVRTGVAFWGDRLLRISLVCSPKRDCSREGGRSTILLRVCQVSASGLLVAHRELDRGCANKTSSKVTFRVIIEPLVRGTRKIWHHPYRDIAL